VFRIIRYVMCIMLAASILVLPGCGSKEPNTPEQDKPNAPEQRDTPADSTTRSTLDLVYKHPDMGKVETKKDVVYKTDNGKELMLDIYYPLGNEDASKAHVVVLIHGKAPTQSLKDTDLYNSWGRAIAANGLAAVTFNWRPSVSPEDVSDLIRYIRENAKELGINGNSISVFAFSAGVKEGIKEALKVNTGFIDSVIAYYGEVDSVVLENDQITGLPPIFIAMAQNDNIIPVNINNDFIEQAKASGCQITYMVHSNGKHGFELYNDDDETRNIIEKTIEFIKENAKN